MLPGNSPPDKKADMDILDPENSKIYFEEAANLLVMPTYIIEKDYWVCWVLNVLFSGPYAEVLTFKGGTSLSKGYKVVERFSEDVDLTIDKNVLALDPNTSLEEPDLSRSQRSKRSKSFDEIVAKFILDEFAPRLDKAIQEKLAGRAGKNLVSLQIDPDDPLNLFFNYPKILDYSDTGYIKPFVRLELGAKGERSPHTIRKIRPYIAEAMPHAFEREEFAAIPVLAIERTFWEKATILHSVVLRPDDKPVRERFSRHYYDTYQMTRDKELTERILQDISLLEALVANKRAYFFESWDWYETARTGSFKLVPGANRQETLSQDYEAMQEMIIGDTPDFSEIIASLQTLEEKINQS